ncbi:hypothetical protein BQ8794_10296 [Mesorhizobium prunaredense]|uniref:Uncharacterized protein n=1 Tax=Mesorhizobium prunaredense TaxID=1631249 RepID=A0A1R3V129_9HYPH|nr:hypothetical protein BQ8794_10296 [Mesorhizobium prunaredense]
MTIMRCSPVALSVRVRKTTRDFECFIPAISEMPYRSRLFNCEGALLREKERLTILRAPLCPAGHLPHKEGDWQLWRSARFCDGRDWRKRR